MSLGVYFDGNLPAYVNITDGKTADNKGAYDIPLLANSVVVSDRYYNDFSLLNVWSSSSVFFVVKHKDNLQFKTVKENNLPADRQQHIVKDEIIELTETKFKIKNCTICPSFPIFYLEQAVKKV